MFIVSLTTGLGRNVKCFTLEYDCTCVADEKKGLLFETARNNCLTADDNVVLLFETARNNCLTGDENIVLLLKTSDSRGEQCLVFETSESRRDQGIVI